MQRRILNYGCLFAAIACVVAVLGGTVLAQGTDSQVGTWKLNAEKSTFSPAPGPKSVIQKIEAAPTGRKIIVDTVQADGSKGHWEYTASDDGKDSPITGSSPFGDTVARTRIDATTTQLIFKKGGKVLSTQTLVVSADGKTRTDTRKGVNAAGQTVSSVTVYDKQ
jgi:hypothetical protein